MKKGITLFWSGLLLYVVVNTYSFVGHLNYDPKTNPISWLARYLIAGTLWTVIYRWNPAWLRNFVGYTSGILSVSLFVLALCGVVKLVSWNWMQLALSGYIAFVLIGSHEVRKYLEKSSQPGNREVRETPAEN